MSRSNKLYGELALLVIFLIAVGIGVMVYIDHDSEKYAIATATEKQRSSTVKFASPTAFNNPNDVIENYVLEDEYIHFAKCTVTQVTDGDKFYCKDLATGKKIKITLFGLAAPLLTQAYGYQAKLALSKEILGKTVFYSEMFIDDYSRIASVVYYDHKNINIDMLLHGEAHVDTRYNNRIAYLRAQDYAINNLLGLWNLHYWDHDRPPIKPWEYDPQVSMI